MSERARRAVLIAGVILSLGGCGGPATSPEVAGTNAPDPDFEPGQRVPELAVEHFDGSTTSLADHAGTPVIVNFWASWCAPCIDEMPDLERVHRLADGDVTVVGVNTQDTPARAAELVDETGVTYELVRDPDAELSQAFGVRALPATFYVDAEGRIVAGHTGILTFDAIRGDLREHLGVDLATGG